MRKIVTFSNRQVMEALLTHGVNQGMINSTTVHNCYATFTPAYTVFTFHEGPTPKVEVPAIVSVQPPAKKQNKLLTVWGTELPLATIYVMLVVQKIQLAMNKIKRIGHFVWHRVFQETE